MNRLCVCIKYLIMSKAKTLGIEITNTTVCFGALNVHAKRAKIGVIVLITLNSH